jgi:hypothetical protein
MTLKTALDANLYLTLLYQPEISTMLRPSLDWFTLEETNKCYRIKLAFNFATPQIKRLSLG